MFNTILLIRGFAQLTEQEFKKFSKGDTIWGTDSNPEELKRWDISQKEEAKAELEKYRCSYEQSTVCRIEEYALEYCKTNEEGEFEEGSDYDLAEEI